MAVAWLVPRRVMPTPTRCSASKETVRLLPGTGNSIGLAAQKRLQLLGIFQVEGHLDQAAERSPLGERWLPVHLGDQRRKEQTVRSGETAADDDEAIEQRRREGDRVAGDFAQRRERLPRGLCVALRIRRWRSPR